MSKGKGFLVASASAQSTHDEVKASLPADWRENGCIVILFSGPQSALFLPVISDDVLASQLHVVASWLNARADFMFNQDWAREMFQKAQESAQIQALMNAGGSDKRRPQ